MKLRFRVGMFLSRARQLATPSLIDLMSLRLVIPGGLLSSRARFRFTNRRPVCDNQLRLATKQSRVHLPGLNLLSHFRGAPQKPAFGKPVETGSTETAPIVTR